MRRLGLGLFLIAAASSVLLISDLNQRKFTGGKIPRVAIYQHASQGIIDDGVRGMVDILAENGFVDGKSVQIRRFNAENDVATANTIAKEISAGAYDLVLTATTVSLQTFANANRDGKTKHVFGLVSDPVAAGVGVVKMDSLEHPKHMTGIGTMQPVRETFELAKKLNPALKTVGVAWNPAEANSQANVRLARTVAKDLGMTLLEANIENSSGVLEASNSLVSRGAQALWVGGDVTVLVGIDSVLAAAKKGKIPVFTSVPGNSKKGAIFDIGANYYEVGRTTGAIGVQVLKGADPAAIEIKNVVPARMNLNKTAVVGLKDPWKIPDDVVAKADSVIDAGGEQTKAVAPTRPNKKWNIQIIQLNNVLDVEESEQGVFKGLEEAKLEKGRDYDAMVRNAQGDMATLNGLVDAAIASGADLLITMSTPTLQAALQRSQGKVPIVFTYVSNAFIAGAGTTNENHLPNVTGTTMMAPYDEVMPLLKQSVPGVKRIGTLFVPSEINMVFNKDELVKTATKAGLQVEAVGVATSSEVPDAALALMGRNIDALVQIPGNLTAAAFGGIAQAAKQKKVPAFAFQNAQAKQGASIVLARDYYDAGREAAAMAARIMRGESPAKIPFLPIAKTTLMVNPAAAQAIGFTIPPAILSKAQLVKE